jgi:hypothetical protein
VKRRVLVFLCAGVFMAVAAAPAWADRGTGPGTTFPEHFDGPLPYQQSCDVLASNPGVEPSSGRSAVAIAIQTALYHDSCEGGP